MRSGSRLVKRWVSVRKETKQIHLSVKRFSELRARSGVQVTLDSLLRLYRQENTHPDEEIHVRVKRGDRLHAALKAVTSPDFCFGKTPIVSFRGEEPDGNEPIREFFR